MHGLAVDRAAYPSETLLLAAGKVHGEPIHLAVEEIRGVPAETSNGGLHRREVLVFLHGVLSNRETWAYVAGHLGQFYDLLLVDLPGCGESDKPDANDLGPSPYNPEWLADTVMTALEDYLRVRGDDVRFTLVGHSLGGTVILRMLAEPQLLQKHAALHDRFDAAVMLAPLHVRAVEQPDSAFDAIANLNDFEAFFGRLFGTLSRETSRAVYYGTTDPQTMPREEWLRLYEIISNGETRAPAQWMLRSAVWGDDANPARTENQLHTDHYAAIDVPCMILWGEADETIAPALGYQLQRHINNSELVIFPRSKHPLPSERPIVVAEQILAFLARNGSPAALLIPAMMPQTEPDPVRVLPLAEINASDQFKRDGIRPYRR